MAEELDEAEQVLAEGDVLEKTRGKALRLAGEAFALTVAAEVDTVVDVQEQISVEGGAVPHLIHLRTKKMNPE